MRNSAAEKAASRCADAVTTSTMLSPGCSVPTRCTMRLACRGQRLPASVAFDHPTPQGLTDYLESELLGTEQPPEAPAPVAPSRSVSDSS